MDQALPLVMGGMPLVGKHYDKVTDPAKHRYRRMRGLIDGPDPDVKSVQNYEDKGYILRKRSEVASDEEIVEVVRHRGQRLPRRPGLPRQSSSMDDMRNRQMVPYNRRNNRDAAEDSEGSVPPRSRAGRGGGGGGGRNQSRGRAKSANGGKTKSKRGSSSSSANSSDLGSTTSDEKKCKKASRKKWITAGLAGVATVHAASKVYSSIEAHDKRIQEVERGEMSPEDAHKKQRAARWQDAAAIAIAALGLKGAISEWNETMEEHHEHQKLLQEREEHHKKRLERQRREKARKDGYGGYYKGRDGNWYYDGADTQGYGRDKSRNRGRGGGGGGGGGSDNGYGHDAVKAIENY